METNNFDKFWEEDLELMGKYYPNLSLQEKEVYVKMKHEYQKKYNFSHMEFFSFNLGGGGYDSRSFFPRKEQAELYNKVNQEDARELVLDKYASYMKLKRFYKRKACAYNPHPNKFVQDYYVNYDWKNDITEFLSLFNSFIIKPLGGNSGNGIKVIHNSSLSLNFDNLISNYPEGFIIEELIEQVNDLAQFHPQSINTIRICTYNTGKKIYVNHPCFRTGCGDSIVDNAHGGGIFAAINVQDGTILSAISKDAIKYREHPDTHIVFAGFKIPQWNNLCETAIEVAKELPQLKICGMDFALTERGWVLVEVNCFPHCIYQEATQRGIRKDIDEFLQQLNC